VEVIGIIATLFIILAFLNKDVKKIRIFDIVGALLFILYGLLIKSFSTVLLNLVLTGVNIYQLYKLKGGKENA